MIPDCRITSIVRSAQAITIHSRAVNCRLLTIAVKRVKYNASTFPILLYCCRTQTVRQENIFSVHIRASLCMFYVCWCVCVCVSITRQMFEWSLLKSKARRIKTLLSSICWWFAVRVEDPGALEGGYRYKMLRLLSHQRRDFILVSTMTTTTMTRWHYRSSYCNWRSA